MPSADPAADVTWPYSVLLDAVRMESNSLVKDSANVAPNTATASNKVDPDTPSKQPLSGMDRPLKIELDDSCSKRSVGKVGLGKS